MENRVLCQLGMALPLAIATIVGFTENNPVFAQLTPDNTLGAESSIVTPQQLRDLIQGGAIRDNSLFHSFDEFNVGEGRGVFFDLQNNTDILNILTRVTGSNSSNILGTLGVLQDALNSNALGDANLFLLNPNGITFGANANLQLNGSFFATTADGFGFDNFTFSASGQEAPPPLLTVSIPRFASFRDNPGDIVNQSIAQNPDGNFGLQVPSRESLTLVGGNVNFQTGWIVAPGARVEIGGLAEAGTIGINDNLSLSLPNNLTWGDISFRNTSFVNVSSNGGGSITINALNLDVSGGSQLAVGITSSSDSQNPQSGDINLNATESITLSGQDTVIFNQVATGATGNAGDVLINAPVFSMTDGAQIASGLFGNGSAGLVQIEADIVSLDGQGTTIFSQITAGGGTVEGILIDTDTLSLTEGARLVTTTLASGNASDITINANNINFDGFSADGTSSGILATVQPNTQGNGGNVNITTDSLSLTNGAVINVSTLGIGNAGNTTIDANTITLDASNIFAQIAAGAQGSGGSIDITTDSLELINGASISASTFGEGDAGSVTIDANTVSLDNSNIRAQVQTDAQGNGGSINITTNSLDLTNDASLSVTNFGIGNAGNTTIDANTITLDTSNIFAQVATDAQGTGGSINIATDSLILTNGAQINATTFGIGDAGNINIRATDDISIDGVGINGFSSSITANVVGEAVGESEDINIVASSLSLTNGGFIGISTFSQGDGGSIVIDADTITADGVGANGISSGIQASVAAVAQGDVGDIFISTDSLELTNGAQINAGIFGLGNAGDITIVATETISIDGIVDGNASGIFSNAAEGSIGNSGNINASSESVIVRDGGLISVNNLSDGLGGNISITSDTLTLDDGRITANTTNDSNGNITLNVSDYIFFLNGDGTPDLSDPFSGSLALISANSQDDGGNITINTTALVAIPEQDSDITANSLTGSGAGIVINANGVFGIQISDEDLPNRNDIITTSGLGPQIAGQVIFNTPETNPQPETEVVDPSDTVSQSFCSDFGGDSQLSNTGRGGIPQIPGLVVRNSVINIDLVDEVLPAPPPEAIKPHHRTDVTFLDSNGEEFKPAMGAVLLPNGMVEFVDYNPAEVYRDMYASAGCSGR